MLLLHDVLALSNHLPTFTPVLVHIINACMNRADVDLQAECADSCANTTWVVGACLQCLASRHVEEWASNVDLVAWARVIVNRWGWSSFVLSGLVSVIGARYVPYRTYVLRLATNLPPMQLSYTPSNFFRGFPCVSAVIVAFPFSAASTRLPPTPLLIVGEARRRDM